ncbi:MAG: NAD-dependent epimerase/dehydratase family protein [Oligoflexia bacterium]|jgi:UDP-glucose 4-epimerase
MTASVGTILVTGAAGGLAGTVVRRLAERYHLVGADPRPLPRGKDFPGEFHVVDYTHRKMGEIFRSKKIDVLLHLGRLPVSARVRSAERYQTNVLGTKNLLELCRKYRVKRVVVLSTFHVYGAHSTNPGHLLEEDPLRASQNFPELRDAVEMDHMARMFLLQNSGTEVVILRPSNIVGPTIQNTISQLLRSEICPVLMGYDPLLQFIYEADLSQAIELCVEKRLAGVYNVSGEGVVSYRRAVELAGSRSIAVPHFLVYGAMGVLSRLRLGLPKHLVDFYRYSAVISDDAFRKDSGYAPLFTTQEALRSLRSVRSVVEPLHSQP